MTTPHENWRSKTTPAKIKYWESMRGKSGGETPRWKGESASKEAKHQWLNQNIGNPTHCSNKDCKGKSKIYEWCLKIGHEYTHDPKDYLWLCRSCHRAYDLTPQKREQAIKNLRWNNK